MKCWISRGSNQANRSCLDACSTSTATLPRTGIASSLDIHRKLWKKDSPRNLARVVGEAGKTVCSRDSLLRARSLPDDRQPGATPALAASAGVAPQTPLPPLPIERGDNTLTRTLSGLILGAFGSLCIYTGGLLFTGISISS